MERMLKTGEAARYLNVAIKTLQRWDRSKRLVPDSRSEGKRRLYSQSQLVLFRDNVLELPRPYIIIAYCCVSPSHRDEKLLEQREAMIKKFVRSKGWRDVLYLSEYGYYFDYMRPKFLTLMDSVGEKLVKKLILIHPDDLVETGYEWFKRHIERNGGEIIVVDNK
jgi:predicted site-specific integrase-resolvase